MDRNVKWRTFWLAVLTILAVLMLVPTVVPSDQLPTWFSRVFNRKIQLGLDLQGGLHIVYGIDLDKAVDDKASEIKRDIETKLVDLKLEGRVTTPATPLGAVNVIMANAGDKGRIDGAFLSDYDDIVVKRDCPDGPDKERSVCIRVSSDYADGIKKSALEQAVRTVRERIDERGISEPNVVDKGDQIIVELPGLDKDSIKRVKELIERTAKLEFKLVDEDSPYMQALYGHVVDQIVADTGKDKQQVLDEGLTTKGGIGVGIDSWTHDDTGKQYYDYFLTAKDTTVLVTKDEAKKRDCYKRDMKEIGGKVECPVSGRAALEAYVTGLGTAQGDAKLKLSDEHMIGYEAMRPAADKVGEPTLWRTYYLQRAVELAGSAVANSYVYWNPTSNRPEVLIEFNRWGGRRFGEMTGKAVGKRMAIILDDKVTSAPVIQSKIDGGRSSITMGGSDPNTVQTEAQDLVNVLRTGSLPAPLKIDSESEIGPLLGRDAIEKTKFAFLLGAGLIVIIMAFVYRASGLISLGALVLNVLFMLGAMAALGATLTLPGIAALVLTLGMAVDANIVIYERARDELRHGKSVRGSVDAGFYRGFTAVLDGHLTTGMAGLVLYFYGSGPIKGFAVMLMIGIATTLLTAVWATRLFFDYYLRRNPSTISI
jgi:preprotein translocase subunit SecD